MNLHQILLTMIDAIGLRKPDPTRDNPGVCFGIALTLAGAVFAGNLNNALNTLKIIKENYSHLSASDVQSLSQSIQSYDIIALLSSIAIAQLARNYTYHALNLDGVLPNHQHINSQDSSIETIMSFILFQPNKTRKQRKFRKHEAMTLMINRNTLTDLLNELKAITTKTPSDIVIIMSTLTHTVSIIFEMNRNALIHIDPRISNIAEEFETTAALAKNVFMQLNSLNKYLVVNIKTLSDEKQFNLIKSILSVHQKKSINLIKLCNSQDLCRLYTIAYNAADLHMLQQFRLIYMTNDNGSLLKNLNKIMWPMIITPSIAIYNDWDEVAYGLIWFGTQDDYDNVDSKGYTALHYALINKKFDIANLMLVKGTDSAFTCDAYGNTPLFYAIFNEYWEIADRILDAYPMDLYALSIKIDTDGNNHFLHHAAQHGKASTLKKLVQLENNVNILNKEHKTPLHLAALHGQIDAVRFLLTCPNIKIDALDKHLNTAKHYAHLQGHFEISALIERTFLFNASLSVPYSINFVMQALRPMLNIQRKMLYSYSTIADPIAVAIVAECQLNPSPQQLLSFINAKLMEADSRGLNAPALIHARKETVMRMKMCVQKIEEHLALPEKTKTSSHTKISATKRTMG